jgi:flagellar biogenesis protein FliO
MRRLLLLVLLVALACLPAWTAPLRAADPPETNTPAAAAADPDLTYSPQWPEPPNTGAMLLRLCLGTVFVLALCAGSLFLARPWLQKLQTTGAGSQALQVEASVPLGNRAVLYLVKVGDTQLVAGTDATGLKSLIALPGSFKEMLDEQVPITEAPALRLHATPEPQEGAA